MPDGRYSLSDAWSSDCRTGSYLAAFHAAQALIYERTSRVTKTHRGVRVQFSRIAREIPVIAQNAGVLAHGFELKSQADYGTGPEASISVSTAEVAIEEATRFLRVIEELLK
jgi:uncharacterized protein (UPF0332 family)